MIEIRQDGTGFILPLRVTPRGGQDAALPFQEGDAWIRLKVKAPPEDGKANAAVIALVAQMLGVPKSAVALLRGDTSRVKQVRVNGSDAPVLSEKLAQALHCDVSGCLKIMPL